MVDGELVYMRKIYLMLLLLLIACGPAGTPATAPEGSSEPAAEAEASISEPTAMATEVVEKSEEPSETGEQSDDSSVSGFFPATTLAEASIVRPTDHALGATDPVIAIIEYGDFQ
jgi:hypothetical protein